jgi:hypothetical protein
METEKIISTLKEKIGTTSLSDRTISDYVNNNLLADGTEPDDNYFTKHSNILKSLSGNFNADVATRVEDFKKNYKPTIQNANPKREKEPTNDFEERLKAIEEANEAKFKALKEELSAKDKALEQKSYVSQLEGKFKAGLEDKGLVYDPIYFEHIVRENGDFDTSKSIDDSVKSISEKYDKMFKDRNRQITANGFISDFQVQLQAGGEGSKSAAEMFKERMREQGYLPNTESK